MNEYFEIFGTRIKLNEIKDFRLVQKEYIYRATYKEIERKSGFKNLIKATFNNQKVEFIGMQPYAAIYDENKKELSIAEYKAKDFKESAGKDLVEGVVTKIGEKFNMKAIKSKKYCCINQTGRTFTTYLEDIPAKLIRADGDESDIKITDEMYHLLDRQIAPTINIVEALKIITKKQIYIFYGNGIQIESALSEYNRLKDIFDNYNKNNVISNVSSMINKIPLFKNSNDNIKENNKK